MILHFVGIDLGTSGCRINIIDKNKVIQYSQSILYANPDQQTPELWWNSVSTLLKELPTKIKESIVSIAINGTSGSVLLCDDSGEPLTATLMYNDLRAIEEAEKIKQVLPRSNGGHGLSSSLARVLWLLKHELNENIQKEGGCISSYNIVHQADYILGKLSNNYSISDENNCLKLGYDVFNQRWPEEQMNTLGIKLSCLPKVYSAGTVVADIDRKQADDLGLLQTLKMVTGTTDSIAAFIATGANQLGDAVTSLGSTLVLKLISEKPIFSPEHGVYSHQLNNQWLVGGASNSGAKVLQHYFTQEQLNQMTPLLQTQKKLGLNYYPLLKVGERFPVADVNKIPKLTPRPASDIVFFQGILEGLSRIETQGYQKLVELGATPVKSIRSVGGGSFNNKWTEMREKMLNIDMMVDMVTPPQTEAAYGSALLAQQGFIKDKNRND